MASAERPSSQQQAGYMCASQSYNSIEESSCIRGGSIYATEKVAQLNRGRVSDPAQAASSGSQKEAPGSAGGNLTVTPHGFV